MRDSNLALRAAAAGNLTATGNGSAFDIGKGGVVSELAIIMVVPSGVTGTSPTLAMAIQTSDDNFVTVMETFTMPTVTAAGTVGLSIQTRRRYLRYSATVGGTTPNFGAVTVHASSGLTHLLANIANT